ncbi:hypothetical protein BIV24_13065 [Streptomyces colonosanans]|uniref:Uncharacterized protein n=2 Tax=Streptomyces colonosanans TaxID=1428652 RepID=A0A1S2PGE0_9ACTN|nr:hypothetical protein BIV24_13065 [Streptomyces colonosanans]
MQTAQNLGQTLVLALAAALFSAVAAAPSGRLPAFTAAFLLLVLPIAQAACLAGRTRLARPDVIAGGVKPKAR